MSPDPSPSILLVCSGNTCRSPMAAAILRDLLARHGCAAWRVSSAGISAASGEPAAAQAVEAMQARGLSLLAHRSRRLERPMVEEADLILVMEARHRSALLEQFPEVRAPVLLLGALAEKGQPEAVSDPFGGTTADYSATAGQLRRLLEAGLERILALAEAQPRTSK